MNDKFKKNIFSGEDDFKSLIENNGYYVDKTKMIEELLNNLKKVFLFPRPRRFGKTLTMSMIENFFEIEKKEDNKELFKGLYIEKSKYYEERGKYPVINLTFKSLKKNNYNLFYDSFIELISNLYISKNYVYNTLDKEEKEFFKLIKGRKANTAQYQLAIANLTHYLEKYHQKKVIILIDEYDAPISEAYVKSDDINDENSYYNQMIDFIREVFSSALKTNSSVYFTVLTGILRVSKEAILSGLNNVKVYGIMNSPFGEYFGFNREETRKLLRYYNLDLTDEVKEIYDGYNFNSVEIYNPWSILNYASDKILSTFWINTSGNEIIHKMLINTNEENKQIIDNLVSGTSYEFVYDENITYKDFNNYNNINVIFNLLFASGYLTFDKTETDEFGRKDYLKIPNKEVKEFFKKVMTESIYGSESSPNIRALTESLSNHDMKKLEKVLNDMLVNSSYMDTKEMYYHGFIMGLFSLYLNNNNFIVKSNREMGKGRCDVFIEKVDKSYGYIFEFKIADDRDDIKSIAIKALEQIENKEYYQELVHDKVKNIYKVAIVFKGKTAIVR